MAYGKGPLASRIIDLASESNNAFVQFLQGTGMPSDAAIAMNRSMTGPRETGPVRFPTGPPRVAKMGVGGVTGTQTGLPSHLTPRRLPPPPMPPPPMGVTPGRGVLLTNVASAQARARTLTGLIGQTFGGHTLTEKEVREKILSDKWPDSVSMTARFNLNQLYPPSRTTRGEEIAQGVRGRKPTVEIEGYPFGIPEYGPFRVFSKGLQSRIEDYMESFEDWNNDEREAEMGAVVAGLRSEAGVDFAKQPAYTRALSELMMFFKDVPGSYFDLPGPDWTDEKKDFIKKAEEKYDITTERAEVETGKISTPAAERLKAQQEEERRKSLLEDEGRKGLPEDTSTSAILRKFDEDGPSPEEMEVNKEEDLVNFYKMQNSFDRKGQGLIYEAWKKKKNVFRGMPSHVQRQFDFHENETVATQYNIERFLPDSVWSVNIGEDFIGPAQNDRRSEANKNYEQYLNAFFDPNNSNVTRWDSATWAKKTASLTDHYSRLWARDPIDKQLNISDAQLAPLFQDDTMMKTIIINKTMRDMPVSMRTPAAWKLINDDIDSFMLNQGFDLSAFAADISAEDKRVVNAEAYTGVFDEWKKRDGHWLSFG